MKTGELERLMVKRSDPCLTIIVPIDDTNHKKNLEVFRKSVQKAKALLTAKGIPEETKSAVIRKLDEGVLHLSNQVVEGLGIFISPATLVVLTFPFEVITKVTVADHFETRDLLYLTQYAVPYYVVNLNKKGVHLFRGNMSELEEVKDGKFPFSYEDQYEYQRASFANDSFGSLKGFEKDKTEISDIRLKAVFREADSALTKYLTSNATLLVAGTQKTISLYKRVSAHAANVTGKIAGSYNENNFNKLSLLAWREFMRATKQKLERQVDALREDMNGHLAEGIRNAWIAAQQGKGLMLMVEKDFHHRGYVKDGMNGLFLQPPKKPYEVVADAVDILIELVQNKKGKVVLMENDKMKDYGHLALRLRY